MPGLHEMIRAMIGNAIPDGRPIHQTGQIRTPHGNATPTFCSSCGTFTGWAYVETSFILALCDECHAKHGDLPLPVVADEIVQGRGRKG